MNYYTIAIQNLTLTVSLTINSNTEVYPEKQWAIDKAINIANYLKALKLLSIANKNLTIIRVPAASMSSLSYSSITWHFK